MVANALACARTLFTKCMPLRRTTRPMRMEGSACLWPWAFQLGGAWLLTSIASLYGFAPAVFATFGICQATVEKVLRSA